MALWRRAWGKGEAVQCLVLHMRTCLAGSQSDKIRRQLQTSQRTSLGFPDRFARSRSSEINQDLSSRGSFVEMQTLAGIQCIAPKSISSSPTRWHPGTSDAIQVVSRSCWKTHEECADH